MSTTRTDSMRGRGASRAQVGAGERFPVSKRDGCMQPVKPFDIWPVYEIELRCSHGPAAKVLNRPVCDAIT